MHTHMHTQAPLAAKESEAANKHRCLTSQRDAEAQVCMNNHVDTHTQRDRHTAAYIHQPH